MAENTGALVKEREKVGLPILDEFGEETPTKAIARMLHKYHPDLWLDVEKARGWVRRKRGAAGKRQRNQAVQEREHGSQSDTFAKMPPTLAGIHDSTPYIIEGENVLILSDIHIPYHDKAALSVAIDHGVGKGVDTVILAGDVIDFYAISRYVSNPKERDLVNEVMSTRDFLATLREIFPDAEIVWKLGNHDERMGNYLAVRAPELFGSPWNSFDAMFHLEDNGIKLLDRLRHAKIGSLNVMHGHEFGSSAYSPVNAARGFYLRAKTSCIGGHYHQTSSHTERDMNDKEIGVWSLGCLGELNPYYRPYNRWNHGFARVERFGRDFEVHNRRIVNGRVR